MISKEAHTFFQQLRESNSSGDEAFDLETERLNANAAGDIASEPLGIESKELYQDGIRILHLTPENAKTDRRLIFIRGGAFALMSPESHQRLAGHIALACQSDIYILDYSLAPEFPFPAALNETCSVTSTLIQNAKNEGCKTVLMGESAGGALALGAAIYLRNNKLDLPECMAFISPWLDLTLSGGSIACNEDKDVMLSPDNLKLFADYYVQGTEFSVNDAAVSPLFDKLDGLPPIYCQAAGNDILVDDATRLSDKVSSAGGEIELEVFPGMCHSFQFFCGQFPEAEAAIKKIGQFVINKLA